MAIQVKVNPQAWKRGLSQGLKGSVSNRKRALGTAAVSLSTFLLTIFSANPGYSLQMLSSGMQYWSIAFTTRLTGMIMNAGYTGLLLTAGFSMLVGVTMTNTVVQLRMNRINLSSLGALPGFLAGGCASCGVGVLSLLGFGGVLASMPFAGNSLRLGGVLLLVALIIRTGNPDACKI
ncbi:hypothetical protein LC1Nh_0813 [Candidatus Nanohalobium constans]|uniref:Uncharacterized protein n=2 Tax=Candidatus Nanohalobium constans TaxID=2565781 RepID=A0A5Q0UGG1_9ARCH|nr:hypothetical protein LC1Nh_0813 [Candidatus Nanohalobium constans]